MTNPLDLLKLEKLDEQNYRALNARVGWYSIFGGQIIGQAAAAATASVGEDRLIHSLHAYFIRAAGYDVPIDLEVHTERDGSSFSARRVQASQSGKALLTMLASFHTAEAGPTHDLEPIPDVPDPESLPSLKQLSDEASNTHFDMAPIEALDIRPVIASLPYASNVEPPHASMWVRMPDCVTDDRATNRLLVAHLSDLFLISTALQPYRDRAGRKTVITSLDHAVWFHDDWKVSDWMLVVQDSPFARNGRSMCRSVIYGQDGRRIADVAQEGLLRLG